MQVTIEYAAQLKAAAGAACERVAVDAPCTVEECIRLAAERHGESLRKLLLGEDGSLHSSILVFVGDEQVRWSKPRELKEGDVVTLLSPISGG
jgi:molybdopterin converting factor small subunit